MLIRFGFEIVVSCPEPVPMLLALSVHSDFAGRLIGSDRVRSPQMPGLPGYIDQYGNRITRVTMPVGETMIWSDCIAEIDALADDVVPHARQHALEQLPDETLTYLLPSRYCESDLLGTFAWKTFGRTPTGWARVQAICDFVHNHVSFDYKFGRPDKTANDVLTEKTGVCRDFAHLAISLCRAMNIPARYSSGYLGDIGVEDTGFDDYCAWFEVFLAGQWYTFDARYNTPRVGRILMVRGHDASDVAIITSFGAYELKEFRVWTHELPAEIDDAALHTMLSSRPDPKQRGVRRPLVTSAYMQHA
ncbi:MAG: transglutaminase family protein [Alphaproteobacteria bacterium]